jgi:hypothetical protein
VRLLIPALLAAVVVATAVSARGTARGKDFGPALVSVYPAVHPRGVMATTGGWAYCQQVKDLARNTHYTLVCGRYDRDGYTGLGLRTERRLDWGDPAYLSGLAAAIAATHRDVGGDLVLIGVSYSGFGVATLAAHHPELAPARLIVLDSYLDLPSRRAAAEGGSTATEIDAATGGAPDALLARSVDPEALAALVRAGTSVEVVWTIAAEEAREFRGATCDAHANAGILAQTADTLGRPLTAWVTQAKHGHDLWASGRKILAGRFPGTPVEFRPGAGIPAGSVC